MCSGIKLVFTDKPLALIFDLFFGTTLIEIAIYVVKIYNKLYKNIKIFNIFNNISYLYVKSLAVSFISTVM